MKINLIKLDYSEFEYYIPFDGTRKVHCIKMKKFILPHGFVKAAFVEHEKTLYIDMCSLSLNQFEFEEIYKVFKKEG